MPTRLFELWDRAILIAGFVLCAANPGPWTALTFVAAGVLCGSREWMKPEPVKPATVDQVEKYREEVKSLRAELGFLKTSFGLGKSTSRKSIFQTNEG